RPKTNALRSAAHEDAPGRARSPPGRAQSKMGELVRSGARMHGRRHGSPPHDGGVLPCAGSYAAARPELGREGARTSSAAMSAESDAEPGWTPSPRENRLCVVDNIV